MQIKQGLICGLRVNCFRHILTKEFNFEIAHRYKS